MVHQFQFYNIINTKKYSEAKRRPSHKQIIVDVIRFVEAGVNEQLIPTKERLDTLIAWKLIEAVPADNPVNAYQVNKEIKKASDIWIAQFLGKTLVEDDVDVAEGVEGDENNEKKDDEEES